MLKIVVRWLLLAAALLLVAQIYPGVVVTSFGSALIAAFVLGLLNALLRPLLVLLTFPVTVLTLEQVNAAWRKYVDPSRVVLAWGGDFKSAP